MPYRSVSDLPESVRAHLPEHAQEIYLEAYNNALRQYQNPGKRTEDASLEETASRVAWSAVKKKYKKNEQTSHWEERA